MGSITCPRSHPGVGSSCWHPRDPGTEPTLALSRSRTPAAMHKHYTVRFIKGALPLRTPTEHYFLDPELGQQKGRGSVWGSWQGAWFVSGGGC